MAIIIIRTIIVYFSLLITMRLLGKRQLGEMELSEFILAALIADLASLPLQDLGIPMINGLVPIMAYNYGARKRERCPSWCSSAASCLSRVCP